MRLLLFAAIEPAPADSTGSRPATGLRYQISVLDDSAARHGPGGLAIINFSGLALAGKVGSTDVTLTTGLNPTLPVGRSAKIMLHTSLKGRSYQWRKLEMKAGERTCTTAALSAVL